MLVLLVLLCSQKQTEPNVRNKILYLIQAWSHAFRNEPKYKVVQDTYQIMKVEGNTAPLAQTNRFKTYREAARLIVFSCTLSGHVFPEFKESDAMFAAERVSRAAGERPCPRGHGAVYIGVYGCVYYSDGGYCMCVWFLGP